MSENIQSPAPVGAPLNPNLVNTGTMIADLLKDGKRWLEEAYVEARTAAMNLLGGELFSLTGLYKMPGTKPPFTSGEFAPPPPEFNGQEWVLTIPINGCELEVTFFYDEPSPTGHRWKPKPVSVGSPYHVTLTTSDGREGKFPLTRPEVPFFSFVCVPVAVAMAQKHKKMGKGK